MAPSPGNIETADDTDWFKVTLTAGKTYRFDVLGADSGNGTLADPFMRVRDSAGTSLVSDDDTGTGLNAQTTYTPTSSGTYFVSAGSATSSGTGTYLVTATDVAPVINDDYAAIDGDGRSPISWRLHVWKYRNSGGYRLVQGHADCRQDLPVRRSWR